MTIDLSAAEARRVFLNAQSLATRRPKRRARQADAAAYLTRQGIIQLDSVNVLARAHYLPLFSRMGAYRPSDLDGHLWGGDTFEHWGHEASVMPRDLLPAMHHRMRRRTNWKTEMRGALDRERPGLLGEVAAAVEADGPLTAGDLEHLAPRLGAKGSWWDYSHVKSALEYLFFTGDVAVSRRPDFSRTYDSTERAWGLPPASSDAWGLPSDAAHQVLFDRAIAACGVGTVADFVDHFRLKAPRIFVATDAAALAESAVERGVAHWVDVEGWKEPALLAARASDPGRATGAALLSPFDPACWYRPRLERMFGVEYRIEIYTPAPKRVYGYYCLMFLMGDAMVARVDLKADRKGSRLLVPAAWREAHTAPGARRRPDSAVATALAAELRLMANWLGLADVVVEPRGNLAPALTSEVLGAAIM